MKYIRTKDGRIIDLSKYENIKEDEICYYIINKDYKPNSKNISKMFRYKVKIDKKDITAQADTIEELCDEFRVAGYTTIPKRCDIGIKKLFDSQNKYLTIELDSYGQRHGYDLMTFLKTKPKCCIYGAIWTDKGLIYVAKMNEKGCLELI